MTMQPNSMRGKAGLYTILETETSYVSAHSALIIIYSIHEYIDKAKEIKKNLIKSKTKLNVGQYSSSLQNTEG
jgi:hypothetical protein